MIHSHLSPHLFSKNPSLAATRDGYGEGLLEAAQKIPLAVLTADLEESTRVTAFARVYPELFFDVGVSEQNMVGVAAGLAVSGIVPFINSYAVFVPGRTWEQIRTTVSYNNANVKIAGHHAGLITGADGATHQALEDIALMRALPNMTVLAPCDSIEARKATVAAALFSGPTYIRLQREKTPIITTPETPFSIGKAEVFWQSKGKKTHVVLFAVGPMVHQTLLAARELQKKKILSTVVRIATIKPLDEKTIVWWLKKAGAAVTVEEHSVVGGLGGAIAEIAARSCPTPIEFVGTKDVFGQSGKPHELLKAYHLDVSDIVRAAQKAIKRA